MRHDAVIRALCKADGLPEPVFEYRFAPPRRWRFDAAWPDRKLAVEVQGGLFMGGRHSRGGALRKEHEKLNTAASMGWRVCYVIPGEWHKAWPAIRQSMEASRG